MKVLFVGPVSGYTSYPVVSKGILKALVDAGIYPVVADTTWDGSPDHTEPYFEQVPELIDFLEAGQVFELVNKGILPNETIRHCVSINPSNQLMKIKENKVAMTGMFVGDVDRIPESWKELMEQQDLVLTPSTWGRQVIQDAGVGRPIMVLNHGISEVFRLPEQNVERGENFVFFHPSSAAFYPERKGTPQVLKAFERLVLEEKDVSLKLIFGMKSKPVRELLKNLSDEVKKRLIVQFLAGARSQDAIRRVYVTSHAGVFPSRAEGFGLCPIESRACGVPVVQTFCTGHRDHLDPDDDPKRWGIVEVKHGEMIPAWGKFGRAPEVLVEDVYQAMLDCMNQYSTLQKAAVEMADAVQAQWSWQETTAPLIHLLLKN
jgi:glycosyltransferase involved in cell wall biosynthesis